MDINDFFDNPTIQVKNPLYTGKRDKKHSPFIEKNKTINNTSSIYSDYGQSIDTHGNIRTDIDEKAWDKYNDYGVTVDVHRSLDDLDTEVAEHQSNWTKAGNMLVQTVVGELALGTLTTITDVGGMIIDSLTGRAFSKDYDFSNPLSDKLEEWRKGIEEDVAPIYIKPGEDIGNGGLADPGWYFKGVPSLVSTLTLLLPTKLVAKTIGAGIKGLKSISKARRAKKLMNSVNKGEEVLGTTALIADEAAGKTLTWAQKQWYDPIKRLRLKEGAKITGEAAIMRTMENYQEAGQTFGDMYAESLSTLNEMKPEEYKEFIERNRNKLGDVDTSDKDAVAKRIAHDAATRTFWMDYSNTIFDIIQLGSIRNIGKLAKSTRSAKVMKTQRESINTASLTSEEIVKNAPKGIKKTLNNIKDITKGVGKLAFAESTEGIEEAVNFIAQQEGMTLGRSMLDREIDSSWGDFWNSRLRNYLDMPDLWESAFWGVFGGITFGMTANAYQKRQIYNRNKKLEKERGENAETKERMNLADWLIMSETPEVEAAINTISNRKYLMDKLSRQLKLIEDERNPFDPKGENPKWTEQIELNQALARQRAITDYRHKIAIEALNSGTFDLLVDYMQAEPVRQAMINAGIVSEDGAAELMEETVKDLQEVKKMYHAELAQVQYQAIALNKANKGAVNLPLEYIQMVADNNVNARLRMQAIDRSVNRFMKQIAELEGTNNNQDIRNQIRLAKLVETWSRLEAQKKEIKEGRAKDQNGNPLTAWRAAESIMDIQDKQTAMLNQIKNDNLSVWTEDAEVTNEKGENVNGKVRSLATMLYALRRGSSYYKDGVDFFINAADETFKLTDEELVKTFNEWFKDKPKDVSIATIATIAKQIEEQQKGTLKRIEELQNENQKLFDLYNAVSDLEIQRTSISNEIVRSQTELRNEVDKLHNRTNNLRQELIEDCTDVIRKIHAKYIDTNAADVEQSVIQHFFNNKEQAYAIAREKLTGKDENGNSDAEKLISALKRLNFSYGANRELMATLEWILRAQNEKHKKSKVKSTTSENAPQSPLDVSPTNSPQQQSQTPQQPANAQKQNVDTRPTHGIVLTIHGDGSITSTARGFVGTMTPLGDNVSSVIRAQVVIRDNPDGTSEIKLEDNTKDDISLLLHSDLFDGVPSNFLEQGVQWKLSKNPIIKLTEKRDSETSAISTTIEIIEKGEITTVNQDGTQSNGTEPASPPVERNDELPFGTPPGGSEASGGTSGSSLDSIFAESESNGFNDEVPDNVFNDSVNEAGTQGQGASNSSTGGVEFTEEEKPEGLDDDSDIESKARQRAQRQAEVAEHLASGNGQVDEIVQQQQESAESDEDKQTISNDADDVFDAWVAAVNAAEDNSASQAGTKVTFLSRFVDPYTPRLSNVFTKSVEDLIEEYVKLRNSPIVDMNGVAKRVISLGDLVKLAVISTGSSFDEKLANHLYDLFKIYLNTETASQKYVILDNGVPKAEVIDTLRPDPDVKDISDNNKNVQRVDINKTLSFIQANINSSDPDSARQAQELEEALHNLKPGDKLRIVKGTRDIKFYVDRYETIHGRQVKRELEIGQQAIPRVDGNGSYYMYVRGWRLDVARNEEGVVESDLLDIFGDIFFSDDQDFVAIRDIIVEGIAKNALFNNTTLKALGRKLADIGYIQDLIEQSKQDILDNNQYQNLIYVPVSRVKSEDGTQYRIEFGDVNYDYLLYELITVYRNAFSGAIGKTKEETIANAREALQDYFDKVFSSYESTEYQLEAGEVEVEHVTEGQVIRVFENAGEAERNRDRLPSTATAIADRENASLGIDYGNAIHVTNPRDGIQTRESIKSKSPIKFGAYAVLYSRNAEPEYVNLFGAKLSNTEDTADGTLLNKMATAAYRKLIEDIQEFQESLSDEDFNNVINTIMDIVSCTVIGGTIPVRNNIPLFRATRDDFKIQVVTKPNGMKYVEIAKKTGDDSWQSFKLYQRGQFGPYFGYNDAQDGRGKAVFKTEQNKSVIAMDAARHLMSWIKYNSCFNVDKQGVMSELRKEEITEGFITLGENGVAINIPNDRKSFNATFDSYTDLVFNYGLTRCNLGKNRSGRNFNPKGSVQAANQVLLVSQPKTLSQIQAERNTPNTYTLADGTVAHTNYIWETTNPEKFAKAKELLEKIAEKAENGENVNSLMKELFALAGREETYTKIMELAHQAGIEIPLFPKKLFYNGELNTAEEGKDGKTREYGPVAMARPNDNLDRTYHIRRRGKRVSQRLKKGWTMVGAKWLNMFASDDNSRVDKAIRTLMHERLHHILHEDISEEELNKRLLPEVYKIAEKVKAVVDTVVSTGKYNGKQLSQAELDSWLYVQEVIARPKSNETKGEEFLVEAITSQSFYDVLNQIKWDEEIKENNKKTIFDKILEIIADVLGWTGIAKGSSYDKLLTTLRDFTSVSTNEIVTNEQVDNGQAKDDDTQSQVLVETKEEPLQPESIEETNDDDFDYEGMADDIEYSAYVDPYNGYIDTDNQTPTTASSILVYTPNDLVRNMPIEDRNNFIEIVESGIVEYKCS